MFRRLTVKRRVSQLIRDGVGVHEASWDAGEPADAPALIDDISEWVREAMATMRRPYGVDHVALAFACKDPAGRVVCSNTFGVLRPRDFYGGAGRDRIRAFLEDVQAVPASSRAEIVGAILSLGDLAHAIGLPRAA